MRGIASREKILFVAGLGEDAVRKKIESEWK